MSVELTIEGTVVETAEREYNGKRTAIVVVDTTEKPEYPERLAVEFYDKYAEKVGGVKAGDTIRAEVRVRSRKSQKDGRYFTSVSGWKCEVAQKAQTAPQPPAVTPSKYAVPDSDWTPTPSDPLPF